MYNFRLLSLFPFATSGCLDDLVSNICVEPFLKFWEFWEFWDKSPFEKFKSPEGGSNTQCWHYGIYALPLGHSANASSRKTFDVISSTFD